MIYFINLLPLKLQEIFELEDFMQLTTTTTTTTTTFPAVGPLWMGTLLCRAELQYVAYMSLNGRAS